MAKETESIEELKAKVLSLKRENVLLGESNFEFQRQVVDYKNKWKSALEDIEKLQRQIMDYPKV